MTPANAAYTHTRKDPPYHVLAVPPSPSGDRRTVIGVDQRKDVHDFLASRRSRITPAQAGLPVFDDQHECRA